MSTTPEIGLADLIKQHIGHGWCEACSDDSSWMWHLHQGNLVVYNNKVEIPGKKVGHLDMILLPQDPDFFNKLDSAIKDRLGVNRELTNAVAEPKIQTI